MELGAVKPEGSFFWFEYPFESALWKIWVRSFQVAEGGEKDLVGRRTGSIVAENRFSFLGKEKKGEDSWGTLKNELVAATNNVACATGDR